MNRLEKLKSLQDPEYATKLGLQEMVGVFKNMKGDKGDTPRKGLDYFTPEELASFNAYIDKSIKEITPVKGIHYKDGIDGKTPIKGVDYTDGKNGETPIKGTHYFTESDKSAIIKETLKNIKVKDGVSPKVEDIVPAVLAAMQGSIELKHVKGAPSIEDVAGLIAFLKRGGFRGGGSSSGSTGSLTPLTPTGLVNSSNTVYGVASQPKSVVADGATFFQGAGYTYSAPNITMDNPPTQYIRYYA